MTFPPKEIHTVIWLQTAFLGDIILTTAAFAALKKQYPNIRQILITTKIGQLALKDHPNLSDILIFEKRAKNKRLSQFSDIKKQLHNLGVKKQNTVLLQVHRSARSSLLSFYLGIPTITYEESDLSFFSRKLFGTQTISRIAVWHEAHRIGLLLEPLGISREAILDSRPTLTSVPSSSLASSFPSDTKLIIGIACGSVWGTKRWPSDYYAQLVKLILENSQNAHIILIGSEAEKITCDEVETKNQSHSQRIWNLAGKTQLDDLRWLFPKLTMLITNDSSPIHYASAFNIPTLALFGPTSSTMGFGPLAQKSLVVEHLALPCRPCSIHGPQVCPLSHFKCMKEITPEQVFRQALRACLKSLSC